MAATSHFCDYVMELLAASELDAGGLGHLRARPMFGGYGIFCDDMMFALIAGDVLYVKVDDETRAAFEDAGMGPFTYARKGGESALGYYEVPPDALDAADTLEPWAALGLDAARRARAGKAPARRARARK